MGFCNNESEIRSRMCRHNNTYTGFERITGDTIDISEWLDFEFYDICKYWDVPNTEDNPKIGRWLGVPQRVRSAMFYRILTSKGQLVARTIVQHATKLEIQQEEIINQILAFHQELDSKIGDDQYIDNDSDFNTFLNDDVPDSDEFNLYQQSDLSEEPFQGYEFPKIEEIGTMDDNRQASDVYDKYLGTELQFPGNGDQMQMTRVVKRIRGNNGNVNKPVLYSTLCEPKPYNALLDTSKYLFEFGEGTTKELTANIIAESLFSQIDEKGHHFQLLSKILEN